MLASRGSLRESRCTLHPNVNVGTVCRKAELCGFRLPLLILAGRRRIETLARIVSSVSNGVHGFGKKIAAAPRRLQRRLRSIEMERRCPAARTAVHSERRKSSSRYLQITSLRALGYDSSGSCCRLLVRAAARPGLPGIACEAFRVTISAAMLSGIAEELFDS